MPTAVTVIENGNPAVTVSGATISKLPRDSASGSLVLEHDCRRKNTPIIAVINAADFTEFLKFNFSPLQVDTDVGS